MSRPVGVRYARWNGSGQPFTVVAGTVSRDLPPGRALVAIEFATICGSDVHTVLGHRAAPSPGVLGHEQVGRVVAVSAQAPPTCFDGTPLRPGDRVVWSVTVSCGQCDHCQRELEPKCRQLRKYGHEPLDDDWTLSGGFATHCVLLPGTTIVRVPEDIPDPVAGPASCATATVVAALHAVPRLAGRRVLITGAGMLGITAVAMASQAEAEVVVADPDPDRRRLALRFGAFAAVDPADLPGAVDVAVELSGAPAAVAGCLAALDTGGHAVLAGSVSTGPAVPLDPERVVRQLLTVTGVHNYRPWHLAAAVQFLTDHHRTYPFAELVDGPFALDEIDAAMRAATDRPALRQAIAPKRRPQG